MTVDQIRAVGEVIQRSGQGFAEYLRDARAEFSIILGWALITWGAFGSRPSAWATSIGIYFVASAILAGIAGRK